MRRAFLLTAIALTACSAPGGPYPSLQPRAAETIDPRVQPVRPINDRPVSPALAGKLAALVGQARGGDAAFDAAAAEAERLGASAGAPQSEGWVAAQQALTQAIAARAPSANALGDVDALGADALRMQGGIAPNDLAAMKQASAEVAAIDRREAERIKAIQQRLGL